MSRCFPFPPPNYRKEERILAESIKLQKEQETLKERRRDKKEKRERSKDKKENSEVSERAHKKLKLKHSETNGLRVKDAYYQIAAAKKIEPHMKDGVTEQLERSGLTEEHGPPCHTPEPCESSESTQTSTKGRKLETISQQGSTIIRFKLPLQKRGDSKKPTAIVSEEPCFSGRAAAKDPEPAPAKADEPCFSGRVAGTPVEMQLGESSKSHKKRRDKERKFRDLVMNWKPAPLLVGDDGEEDLGWLPGTSSRRNRASPEANRCNGNKDLSDGSAAASSFQPRACYVPELEMYQLPYVIPFCAFRI